MDLVHYNKNSQGTSFFFSEINMVSIHHHRLSSLIYNFAVLRFFTDRVEW